MEVRDPQGDYATVENFVFDWSPSQLLHRQIVIDRMAASRIDVARQPASSASSGGNYSLPAPVVLRELRVERLELAPPVVGAPVAVALDGSGMLQTLTEGTATLNIRQFDGAGRYALDAAMAPAGLHVELRASEPAHGMVAGIAGLPDLGAIDLTARLDGPLNAIATHLAVSAGPLRAAADGTVDLEHSAADVTLSASAPAMQPRPDVAWQAVALDAHVAALSRGRTRPDGCGSMRSPPRRASPASPPACRETPGRCTSTRRSRWRVPGPKPDLFAAETADPCRGRAAGRAGSSGAPGAAASADRRRAADARTAGSPGVDATVTLAEIAPFAAMSGLDVQGAVKLALHAATAGDATTVGLDGTIGVTGGMPQIRDLVGDAGRLSLAATLRGQDVTLSALQFDGRALTASASGSVAQSRVDLDWALNVSDLAAAAPTLGALQAKGDTPAAPPTTST